MLTEFQRKLFNFCVDDALSYYGKYYRTNAKFDEKTRSKIVDLFMYSIKKEDEYEFESSFRGGNRYRKLDREDIRLAAYCFNEAMITYMKSFGKAMLDIRDYRVKVREIFIKIASDKFREKQLSGLERARKEIQKEKEALLYEGQ